MRERGILFKAEMVRAILDGRKTVTRRLIKDEWWRCLDPEDEDDRAEAVRQNPYGQPGDRLWVRETWAPHADEEETCRNYQRARAGKGSISEPGTIRPQIFYRADGGDPHIAVWRSSMFMPRWASRITLEVVSVRVERLQAITEEDARAEGVATAGGFMATSGCWQNYGSDGPAFDSARASFRSLWESINGPESWDANPWVWRIEFRRLP